MINIYKSLAILITGVTLATGCKKYDGSMNVDPNRPTKASGTQLIANSEMFLPDISSSPFGVHYPQYLSNTSFPDNSRYTTVNFNFYGLYTGPLMNLETVLTSTLDANEGPVVNQVAVAKILKAFFYWHMTDRWGDIPYSEALKGKNNFTPKYDKQQDIYNSLFTLLDEANAAIVTGNIKNDIIYNGDMTRWKKLANTIHLLMALRLSKVDPVKGAAEFNKSVTNGVMTANTDNFAYPHLADPANENYWYNSFTRLGRNWFAVSKPIVDYMRPLDDPRLPVFANKNTAGNYVGLDYGLPGSTTVVINNFSLLGSGLRMQNSPVYLVTYAQSLFARAEAAKLGWIAGGDAVAKTNYDLAIEQSVRQWNNNDISGLPLFRAKPEVQYDPANAIKQIANQRWVHLFLNGYEAWAEWRRTGYPELVAAPGANGNKIPRREGYPVQERANNTANYNAAVAAFPYGGTDDLNARVWWDK
ncbi:SusD/RagB family nutrient-binding outer membrane lipoprotein [Segetibacter sp. 3557_3]|uniref:SusD/RagB family nutrient-binding outer membrane lipoprotein n=1 Tax=Segetibacter sp. 3557_3 TaxID=2547429 RepID=UPI0010590D73|nr:SusD/RagB family nutrient-binding outer membrane lipoprotein [Segetibacter sp. 3557_3]TDH21485.1 SusD/RagB family nutrient-binding outer membrane lipoprotein [Segetibacter sp. 3557_3]